MPLRREPNITDFVPKYHAEQRDLPVRSDSIERQGQFWSLMTSEKDTTAGRDKVGSPSGARKADQEPDWANGLRKLYDSVVDEPLPDSFQDLLSKLDDDKA